MMRFATNNWIIRRYPSRVVNLRSLELGHCMMRMVRAKDNCSYQARMKNRGGSTLLFQPGFIR